jgi:RNA polymerase sigma-70 factor (sigma-E family)
MGAFVARGAVGTRPDDADPSLAGSTHCETVEVEPVETHSSSAGSRGALSRDEEFTAFMTTAAPLLARTAWFLCGDVHRAEELVQQALVKTYLAWPSARAGDPLAYARRTLANARIDSWRKLRREHLTAPEDMPERARASTADAHADRDQLVRALSLLTARQRRVVVLRHLAGLTENEVAQDLGVSVGTVKTTASRGLRRLRVLLEQPAGGAPVGVDEWRVS